MQNPIEVLSAALAEHKPARIYAMFSGGKDSIVSTHFAMEHGAHEVLHINTGIGIKQTREFVRETCKAFGWPLREEHPPNSTYRDFVLKYGFPGPGSHRYAYSWLKERALRKVVREAKTNVKDRVMLVTGVRNLESARRMGFVKPIVREGAKLWVAPMYAYSELEMNAYRVLRQLPKSEVAENLGMSGECLCGAFASPGEFERIDKFYPETAQEIRILQDEAKTAGVHCVWGTRPKRQGALSENLPFMAMCVNCPTKQYLPTI
jgi:3'-phosphoadenosine 5'-phosphosulfate sulfotransferase (PAPS reductase)/FAD synthetase